MIISVTTLNKEVKNAIVNGQLSKEQARQMYESHLKFKADRMKGLKRALIALIFVFILLTVLNLSKGGNIAAQMKSTFFVFGFLLFAILPLVYYLTFGAYNGQFKKAMNVHYSDIVDEFERKEQ